MVYIGEDTYYTIYYGFRIIFVHIGPCVLLVVLNMLLFQALHRTQQTRERLFAPNHHDNSTCSTNTALGNGNGNNPEWTLFNESTNGLNRASQKKNKIRNTCKKLFIDFGTINENELYEMNTKLNGSNLESRPLQDIGDQATITPTNITMHSRVNYPSSSRRDSNSTTIMLIVIVSVFLLLEIPLTITTILHVVQNTLLLNLVDYDTLNSIILITNFFIILSYPINFAIYCGMSRLFRQTFSQLFIKGRFRQSVQLKSQASRDAQNDNNNNANANNPGKDRPTTNMITSASSSTWGVTNSGCGGASQNKFVSFSCFTASTPEVNVLVAVEPSRSSGECGEVDIMCTGSSHSVADAHNSSSRSGCQFCYNSVYDGTNKCNQCGTHLDTFNLNHHSPQSAADGAVMGANSGQHFFAQLLETDL